MKLSDIILNFCSSTGRLKNFFINTPAALERSQKKEEFLSEFLSMGQIRKEPFPSS